MAIIGMKRLSLFALAENREQLLKDLIRLGCLELTEPDAVQYDHLKTLVSKDVSDNREKTDKLNEIINALKTLDKYAPVKTGFFKERYLVKDGEFNSFKAVEAALETAKRINKIAKDTNDLWNDENKLIAIKIAILPWTTCDIPLDYSGTREVDVMFGVCPSATNIDEMIQTIYSIVPQSSIEVVNSDKEQYYLTVMVHKAYFDKVYNCIKDFEFGRVQFGGIVDTAQESILKIDNQLYLIKIKRKKLQEDLLNLKINRTELEKCYDAINIEINKDKMRDKLLKTENVLYITGWVAEDEENEAIKLLQNYTCSFEFTKPEDSEKPPVKIKSSALVRPFGVITQLYSLPNPRGIDPNPYMAPFFFVFFGIMISDAGYGLVMAGVCFFILKKYKLRGMTKQLIALLFLGGISTIIWGALFGSWFGDIIPVVVKLITGKVFIIKPLWFNPLEDPMKMLLFAFALGLIHIFSGMALNAYRFIKSGKWLDAIFDVGFWYMLIIGLLVMLVSFEIGKYLSIIGALGLVLTQGRNEKGIIKKISTGVLSLYNITAYFSDVLSYSRLLALGLATGVIASVINIMGSLVYGNIIGIIVMVVIFIGGHLFNLAINALGAYVHSSRLQYIEFFGKFYESGGKAFNPTYMETKYVDILKEDN